jgi:hypothetical protein
MQFTLTAEERVAVKAEMRAIMIEMAQARETITYSDLSLRLETAQLHYHSFLFTRLLIEIGREEEAAGRGILPAVVVSKATGMPGGGYFRLSAKMGHETSTIEALWRDDLETLFDYWEQNQ